MKLNYSSLGKTSSPQTLQHKTVKSFWTPINTILVSGVVAVFITSSVTICYNIFSFYTSSFSPTSTQKSPEQYATSIPWLQNYSDCEHTGRTWSKGKCWDSEHNMMF